MRRLSLRERLTMASAGGVAMALVLGSLIAYFAVQNELRGQVDDR
jgi:hypothetical protein